MHCGISAVLSREATLPCGIKWRPTPEVLITRDTLPTAKLGLSGSAKAMAFTVCKWDFTDKRYAIWQKTDGSNRK